MFRRIPEIVIASCLDAGKGLVKTDFQFQTDLKKAGVF